MRYHYEKPAITTHMYGKTYSCDHPVYQSCTLYQIGDSGLAVIQQRFDPKTKMTYWSEIDNDLVDILYLHKRFRAFFSSRASKPIRGLYPTVTIRQIMWGLKLKPLPRQRWETYFDRKLI